MKELTKDILIMAYQFLGSGFLMFFLMLEGTNRTISGYTIGQITDYTTPIGLGAGIAVLLSVCVYHQIKEIREYEPS